jgi:hypothetical protein
MKAYGGVDVQVHIFLTSALAGGEWSGSRPGRFTPGRYSPWRTLSSFTIARHWSRSCDIRLQFLAFIIFKSSTDSSRLTAGLPTRRVSSGLCGVSFLQGSALAFSRGAPAISTA